jgi:hypothetical protein
MERYQQSRLANLQTIKDRGLEVLSDWDGRRGMGKASTPIPVTVRNINCGHTFTSLSKNLLGWGVTCSVCARTYKTSILNAWSENNSARWRQTASEWKKYRAEVTRHTRKTYAKHKDTINPHNLPFGRAGTDGAYHLDHIVSVRYGFDNGIPPQQLANVSNLRVIPWLENVVKRDKVM